MSCCGGNCGCGSGCQCGSGCGGCKMFPDFSSEEMMITTQPMVLGFAPAKGSTEGFETVAGAENDCKCKCGGTCTCTDCKCGK